MKKKRIAIGILFFTMMFTGCSGKQEETGNNLEKNSQFHYNLKEAAAYTIDGDDILVSYDGNPVIERYNEKGEKTEELEIEGELHTNLTVNGECLFAVTYTESGMQITEYNMESRELTLHLLPEDMTSVLSMAVTEDEIYLIYWSDEHNEEEENVRYDENDSYYYMGEKAVSISAGYL